MAGANNFILNRTRPLRPERLLCFRNVKVLRFGNMLSITFRLIQGKTIHSHLFPRLNRFVDCWREPCDCCDQLVVTGSSVRVACQESP